jgi:uncharacterized protein (DUF305 family)
MVPHHQNAVNMAKATLKFSNLACRDLSEETDDCIFESILREIINGQNYEIQVRIHVYNYRNCDVCYGDSSSLSLIGHEWSSRG